MGEDGLLKKVLDAKMMVVKAKGTKMKRWTDLQN